MEDLQSADLRENRQSTCHRRTGKRTIGSKSNLGLAAKRRKLDGKDNIESSPDEDDSWLDQLPSEYISVCDRGVFVTT